MAGLLALGMAPLRTIGDLGAHIAGPGMGGWCLGKAGAAVIPTCLPSHGRAAAMQDGNVCISKAYISLYMQNKAFFSGTAMRTPSG